MKKYSTLLLFLFLTLGVSAQLSVNYSIGYGDYKMNDMKDIAEKGLAEMISQTGLNMKLTDNFPGYVTQNFSVTYTINEHEFGMQGGFLSTGAKYAYADYSGSMEAKLLANAYKIGFTYKYHFAKFNINKNPLTLFFELAPSALLTDVEIKEDIRLSSGERQKDKEKLLSSQFGLSVQPMLGARIKLLNHFLIHASAGYDFEFITKVNTVQRVEWSGFRTNIGIGYMF